MTTTLSTRLEEATNEALFIARALGFPAEAIATEPPSGTKVEARYLQLAKRYQELGVAIEKFLTKWRN